MHNLSPVSRYQHALKEGSHQPDDVQRDAVNRLESIYQALTNTPSEPVQSGGLKGALGRLLGKKNLTPRLRFVASICGAAWGGVKPG